MYAVVKLASDAGDGELDLFFEVDAQVAVADCVQLQGQATVLGPGGSLVGAELEIDVNCHSGLLLEEHAVDEEDVAE